MEPAQGSAKPAPGPDGPAAQSPADRPHGRGWMHCVCPSQTQRLAGALCARSYRAAIRNQDGSARFRGPLYCGLRSKSRPRSGGGPKATGQLESLMACVREAVNKEPGAPGPSRTSCCWISRRKGCGAHPRSSMRQKRRVDVVASARLRDYTVAILRESCGTYLGSVRNASALTGHTDIRQLSPSTNGSPTGEIVCRPREGSPPRGLRGGGGLPDAKLRAASWACRSSGVCSDRQDPQTPSNRRNQGA